MIIDKEGIYQRFSTCARRITTDSCTRIRHTPTRTCDCVVKCQYENVGFYPVIISAGKYKRNIKSHNVPLSQKWFDRRQGIQLCANRLSKETRKQEVGEGENLEIPAAAAVCKSNRGETKPAIEVLYLSSITNHNFFQLSGASS